MQAVEPGELSGGGAARGGARGVGCFVAGVVGGVGGGEVWPGRWGVGGG